MLESRITLGILFLVNLLVPLLVFSGYFDSDRGGFPSALVPVFLIIHVVFIISAIANCSRVGWPGWTGLLAILPAVNIVLVLALLLRESAESERTRRG